MARPLVSNGLTASQKPTMPDNRNELGILILAGGHSQRMGMDKALLPLDGQTFIECLVEQCCRLSDHVVVAVGRGQGNALRERFESSELFRGVVWVEDEHQDKGPLAGIEAGLRALEPVCQFGFVIGCDVPVLKPRLAQELLRLATHHDCRAVTPVDGERIFGMTAVYRTDSWAVAGALIDQGNLRVSLLTDQLSARKVELADLREFDPDLVSFVNINQPEAYRDFLISQGYDADADLIERLIDNVQ